MLTNLNKTLIIVLKCMAEQQTVLVYQTDREYKHVNCKHNS